MQRVARVRQRRLILVKFFHLVLELLLVIAPHVKSVAILWHLGLLCQGRLKLATFDRQITRYNSKTSTVASIVNLVRSQVYHTERPPFVCSTFALIQRVARVPQRRLILVEFFQLVTELLLVIAPHVKSVATLPSEMAPRSFVPPCGLVDGGN